MDFHVLHIVKKLYLVTSKLASCEKRSYMLLILIKLIANALHLILMCAFWMLQAFHRHIPVLIRALGSSYSELLKIISDPPQGSENLLMLVGVIFPVLLLVFLILNTVLYFLFCFIHRFFGHRWYLSFCLLTYFLNDKVLQILTQETSPSADLIATVKHLYETKLKVFSIN